MFTAVLILMFATGHLELSLSPPEPAATIEECRDQLNELYAKAQLPEIKALILQQYGPPHRITGECRPGAHRAA